MISDLIASGTTVAATLPRPLRSGVNQTAFACRTEPAPTLFQERRGRIGAGSSIGDIDKQSCRAFRTASADHVGSVGFAAIAAAFDRDIRAFR
jgi:hypothetical protein